MEILVITLILLLAWVVFLLFKQKKEPQKADIQTDITTLKSIGELSVFRIYSKEIVTKKDSGLAGIMDKFLGWMMTKKQIAIIFEFEIEFLYDLLSKEFSIIQTGQNSYQITMPPCKYKYSIKDMKIYDEKNAKLLPFLLPDMLNGFFGSSFSESDKNRLIDEAKDEVKSLSSKLINELSTKIHKSATDTLEAIAKSFGASEISFVFQDKTIANSDIDKSEILIDKKLQKQIIES